MNYIELIKNFWLQHNAYSLTVTETALYFYLLETNNLCRWANTFNRNNGKVLADLSIASLKTLSNARNRLKQVGLIDFKTKNGSPNVVYTLVKFTEVGAEVGAQVGAEVGAEIIKHKHKQKQVGNSGELFPPDQPPKKKPPKPKVEFIPPTAEEVKEYFRDKLPDWELQADIFYNHFSGLGWKTATGWANTFNRNNGKVLADLSIASLKTLSNARNRLKQVGLIDFKTKNGSPNVVYTLVKFTEVGAEVGAQVGAEVGAEIIKHKHKQKQVGNSGELFPPDQPPKKKPPKPKVEFIPPTAEEVKEYFRDKLPDWELQADIFYNHFSGLGWKTATGAKVERWDSRANLWIIEKKQQDNGKTENQAQRQNNRDADKAAKARNLLDEYAAIEQGSNAISHQGEIPDL